MIADIQTAEGSGRRFDPGGVRQGSFRACRSYKFSKVCETFSTAMPCLWHGLRMGETGEPRTGGGKQRTGRSRAMADLMTVVGRAAFQIGRASCRERGCHYVLITVGGDDLQKKASNTLH